MRTRGDMNREKKIPDAQPSPWPLGGEEVILHLVFKWNERPNGVKQRQALWFVDDQLQIPDQHREVHGPRGAERTHLHTWKIIIVFFWDEHAISISGNFVICSSQLTLPNKFFSVPRCWLLGNNVQWKTKGAQRSNYCSAATAMVLNLTIGPPLWIIHRSQFSSVWRVNTKKGFCR